MLLSLLSVAWADPPPPAEPEPIGTRPIKFQPRTEIEFDPLALEGKRVGPGGVVIDIPPVPPHDSFVELRTSWERELLWSIDEIK